MPIPLSFGAPLLGPDASGRASTSPRRRCRHLRPVGTPSRSFPGGDGGAVLHDELQAGRCPEQIVHLGARPACCPWSVWLLGDDGTSVIPTHRSRVSTTSGDCAPPGSIWIRPSAPIEIGPAEDAEVPVGLQHSVRGPAAPCPSSAGPPALGVPRQLRPMGSAHRYAHPAPPRRSNRRGRWYDPGAPPWWRCSDPLSVA